MKKIKSPTTYILPVAVLLLVSLIILLFCACNKDDGTESESPDFAVTASETGIIFSTSEPSPTVTPEITGETVSVSNTSDIRTDFTVIYLENGEKTKKNLVLEAGETSSFEITKGTLYLIRVKQVREGEAHVFGYPFCIDSLKELFAADAVDESIILSVDIKTDRLDINRPLTLEIKDCDFSIETLFCKTELEGKLKITESGDGNFDIGDFFAESEKLSVTVPTIKKINENISYYLRAYSYNGRIIDFNSVKVTSSAQLQALISDDELPKLYENTYLTISGDFTISDILSFNFPISISFTDGITLENPITITTDSKSEMTFSSSDDVELPDFPFEISAPDCSIIWQIPRKNGITMLDTAAHLDVSSINGIPPEGYILGGEGKAFVYTVSLFKNNNKNITEDITWTADGYILKATVDCVCDRKTLENAVLNMTATNGGSIEFDETAKGENDTVNLLSGSGCYFTVTDKSGNTLRYLIETEYKPSGIPVIVLTTESGEEVASNEEYENATFYMNTDGTGYTAIAVSDILIRGRGHSTWKWEKKPYKIKFESKVSVLGLAANKEWTLLANYSDKSLIRNTVALEAAKMLTNMSYAPSQYPVDVFFNGEYIGVYTMGEQLEAKKGRIELSDNGADVDTGYLLEIGGTSSEDVWNETCFYTTLCKYVKVKAPDDETLTKDQVAYIKDWVTKADAAVMAGEGYEDYIDMDSLIDWVILHELSYNIDCCFRRSCYFTKDAGGKLTMGPVWDFDNAFGNFWKDDKTYSTWATADTTTSYIWDNWMCYLINYPEFRQMFKERWEEVKYDLLQNMLGTVETYSNLIGSSADFNFIKWDILNKRVGCEDSSIKTYNTYAKQITYLESFINTRWRWLDENI